MTTTTEHAPDPTATDPAGRVFDAAMLRMRPAETLPGAPEPVDPCPRPEGHRAAG